MKRRMIRLAAVGLVGVCLTGCGAYVKQENADVPKKVTLTGRLVCCNEVPSENPSGWYIDLYSPLDLEDGVVSLIEIIPAYKFQLETMAGASGGPVEVSGILEKMYSFEQTKWVYFIQVVSVESIAAPQPDAPDGFGKPPGSPEASSADSRTKRGEK